MHQAVEAMPDDPHLQAFLYGPLVLAGDLGSEGLEERLIIGPSGPGFLPPGVTWPANLPPRPEALPPMPAIEIPAFKATGAGPDAWIKPGDAPLTFRTTGQPKDVTLKPLNSIFGKRYAVYWPVGY